jgi:hypothetical protein
MTAERVRNLSTAVAALIVTGLLALAAEAVVLTALLCAMADLAGEKGKRHGRLLNAFPYFCT